MTLPGRFSTKFLSVHQHEDGRLAVTDFAGTLTVYSAGYQKEVRVTLGYKPIRFSAITGASDRLVVTNMVGTVFLYTWGGEKVGAIGLEGELWVLRIGQAAQDMMQVAVQNRREMYLHMKRRKYIKVYKLI